MKKIVSIIILLVILLIGTIKVYATDGSNIELNITGQTSIKQNASTLELTISLGNFTGISENTVMAYEANLSYGSNMFTDSKIEGLNGWSIDYSSTTKRFIGETSSSKANTDIAKITLTLKQGLTVGQTDTISLNNILLSDGTNHFQYNKSITITVVEETATNNEEKITITPESSSNPKSSEKTSSTPAITQNAKSSTDTNQNISTNTNNNGATTTQSNSSTAGKSADSTTASKSIPKTGIESFILIAIIVSVIAMGIFRFKARKIK